jgi:Na+-translocating ferredoxin:NAD+ oxidoreductase RnfD subunit
VRNRRTDVSVQDAMEMLLAVLLALVVPALLTYLPPDV